MNDRELRLVLYFLHVDPLKGILDNRQNLDSFKERPAAPSRISDESRDNRISPNGCTPADMRRYSGRHANYVNSSKRRG